MHPHQDLARSLTDLHVQEVVVVIDPMRGFTHHDFSLLALALLELGSPLRLIRSEKQAPVPVAA